MIAPYDSWLLTIRDDVERFVRGHPDREMLEQILERIERLEAALMREHA